jgi:adenylate kinase
MNLVLLGAPGAGKGTQAEILTRKLNIPSISTGEIIRNAVKQQTELGKKAKEYMDNGLLLPDDVVIEIVRERIKQEDCKSGFILDGFPRTVLQAEALSEMGVKIDIVLSIEADDEVIKSRLTKRRQCDNCGTIYHLDSKPPLKEGKCDECGAELIIRKDDSPETVTKRLEVYHEQAEPLKQYYNDEGLLTLVQGRKKISDTTEEVFKALGVY